MTIVVGFLFQVPPFLLLLGTSTKPDANEHRTDNDRKNTSLHIFLFKTSHEYVPSFIHLLYDKRFTNVYSILFNYFFLFISRIVPLE